MERGIFFMIYLNTYGSIIKDGGYGHLYDKIEQEFRAQVAAKYGYKKGNLQKAMESAMTTRLARK